ncbi:MAG: hypothetical protein HMLIMOIP_000785 [Candidatus Nitrosomirales archaeon]|jgi:hypothetical protein
MSVSIQEEDKTFRDPIHDFIDVNGHEVNIIQDPIFQRLRRIKQLSFGYYVYHGADHSRFGHSIGTMHIATQMLKAIEKNTQKYDPKFTITPDDYKTIRLAALLHDVGHKPFSHAIHNAIPEKHEKYSIHLIRNHFKQDIEHGGIDPEAVISLIEGTSDPRKAFLQYLIDGQLDADKLDYLLRDSHYAGVKYGHYDLPRLLDTLCVYNNKLAVLIDGSYAATQLVFARHFMFEQVYLHKTKRAFEGMADLIASHLLENHSFQYPRVKDLTKKGKIEKFANYHDNWFLETILNTRDRNFRKIANQIVNRQNYKEVYSSDQIRRKFLKQKHKDASEQTATGFLQALEIDIKEKLPSLGINKWEIIFDDYRYLPYQLRPYSLPLPHEESEEARTIYTYDKENDFPEAIETAHPMIEAFAKNPPRIKRVFVERDKESALKEFLKKKYKEYFC